MVIRVSGFDWDKCIVDKDMKLWHLIPKNRDYLDPLRARGRTKKDDEEEWEVLSSNRQGRFTNMLNMLIHRNADAFLGMEKIADYTKSSFAPLLLNDLAGLHMVAGEPLSAGLPLGTELRAGDLNGNAYKKVERLEQGKEALLYYQMQFFANLYPNEKIIFDFSDDRMDIIHGLQRYFNQFPELIPHNVTLVLHQRVIESITQEVSVSPNLCTIEGTGFIDAAYLQSTVDMLERDDEPLNRFGSACHPSYLFNRIAKHTPPEGSLQAHTEQIPTELQALYQQIALLQNKYYLLGWREPGKEVLGRLIQTLEKATFNYYHITKNLSKSSVEEREGFKTECTTYLNAFANAYPQYESWFTNIRSTLATLGEGVAEKVETKRQQTLAMILERTLIHLEAEVSELERFSIENDSQNVSRNFLCSGVRSALKTYSDSSQTLADQETLKKQCVQEIVEAARYLKYTPQYSQLLQSMLLTLSAIGEDNSTLSAQFKYIRGREEEIAAHKLSILHNQLDKWSKDLNLLASSAEEFYNDLNAAWVCEVKDWDAREELIRNFLAAMAKAQPALAPLEKFQKYASEMIAVLQTLAPTEELFNELEQARTNLPSIVITESALDLFNSALFNLEGFGLARDDTANLACHTLKAALVDAAQVYFHSSGSKGDKQTFIRAYKRASQKADEKLRPYSGAAFILFNLLVAASMLIGVGVVAFSYNKYRTGNWLFLHPYKEVALLPITKNVCEELTTNTTVTSPPAA